MQMPFTLPNSLGPPKKKKYGEEERKKILQQKEETTELNVLSKYDIERVKKEKRRRSVKETVA